MTFSLSIDLNNQSLDQKLISKTIKNFAVWYPEIHSSIAAISFQSYLNMQVKLHYQQITMRFHGKKHHLPFTVREHKFIILPHFVKFILAVGDTVAALF